MLSMDSIPTIEVLRKPYIGVTIPEGERLQTEPNFGQLTGQPVNREPLQHRPHPVYWSQPNLSATVTTMVHYSRAMGVP